MIFYAGRGGTFCLRKQSKQNSLITNVVLNGGVYQGPDIFINGPLIIAHSKNET